MKPSRYNQLLKLPDGRKFAFSGKTGALAEVTDNAIWAFLNGRENLEPDIPALLHAGFATPCLEKREREILLTNNAKKTLDDGLSLQVAPTMACNFACAGCIQGDEHCGKAMPLNVQDSITAFALESGKDVSIGWYGGEPLLGIDVIRRITSGLSQGLQGRGLSYHASMTTNGSLINADLARELVADLHVTHFQVTIDGTKESHNRTRPFANGSHSYEKVIEGVKHLYEAGATVKVRTNVDKTNWEQTKQLVSELKNEGLSNLLFTAGMKHGCAQDCNLMSTDEFSDVFVQFQQLLYKEGFYEAAGAHLPQPISNACMMNHPYAFAIAPNGDLFKCLDQIEDASKAIGNVERSSFESMTETEVPKLSQRCLECSQLPVCMGGCPLQNNNDDAFQGCNVWRSAAVEVLTQHLLNI